MQLFKFWPNQYLKEAWLHYCASLEENLLALLLVLKILHQTCEQFSVRQIEKNNKNKATTAKVVEPAKARAKGYQELSRVQRTFGRGDFVKYFDSSESEEDESSEEEEEEPSQVEVEESASSKVTEPAKQGRGGRRGAVAQK